jgi:hypothetical protein
MGEESRGAVRRAWYHACLAAIAGVVGLQSIAHLVSVLAGGDTGTNLDLDRSNGVADLLSTVALGLTVGGATALASVGGAGRRASVVLAAALAVLTVSDILHVGAHPSSAGGLMVIGVVGCAGVIVAMLFPTLSPRPRVTFGGAAVALAGSIAVEGLERYNGWFERERGDPIAEYQIVAKEGLELLGWSLVALALWDELLRRRNAAQQVSRSPASPARASSRRRAA